MTWSIKSMVKSRLLSVPSRPVPFRLVRVHTLHWSGQWQWTRSCIVLSFTRRIWVHVCSAVQCVVCSVHLSSHNTVCPAVCLSVCLFVLPSNRTHIRLHMHLNRPFCLLPWPCPRDHHHCSVPYALWQLNLPLLLIIYKSSHTFTISQQK